MVLDRRSLLHLVHDLLDGILFFVFTCYHMLPLTRFVDTTHLIVSLPLFFSDATSHVALCGLHLSANLFFHSV